MRNSSNRMVRAIRERGQRASRAAARRTAAAEAATVAAKPKEPEPFRVLIAVHRPRYRARAERAVEIVGWKTRSLLNREDPIGLMNQEAPNLFILSVDTAQNKNVGFLRAAQRFRADGMRLIGLFESKEGAQEAADLCDAALFPPWRTSGLRAHAARFYEAIRGTPPAIGTPLDDNEDERVE